MSNPRRRKAKPAPTPPPEPDPLNQLWSAIGQIEKVVQGQCNTRLARRALQKLRCAADELCAAPGSRQFLLGKAAGLFAAERGDLLDQDPLAKRAWMQEQVRRLVASVEKTGTSLPGSKGTSCQI
ncbi:MAG: hypothetical protein HYT30_00410 [Parcubacteria group bacterium]|nr:hypothetical protein [Parcubacteria group bacterium]